MKQGGLAVQLYTVREFMQTPRDIAASLRRVSGIGYRAVQGAGFADASPQQVKQMLDDAGLYMCSTHTGIERMLADLDAVIAEHKLWGCPHLAIPYLGQEYRGLEGLRRAAKAASEIGKKCADAGLTLAYHNHSFEFERYGRKTGLDIFYEESDPRYVEAEIDTYWVQHGGGDPAAWCARFKERMAAVHLKDMVIFNGQQTMAEIGEGNLNWPAILQACKEAGVAWYAIEQDTCQRDPFESLRISFENLKAMGLQ